MWNYSPIVLNLLRNLTDTNDAGHLKSAMDNLTSQYHVLHDFGSLSKPSEVKVPCIPVGSEKKSTGVCGFLMFGSLLPRAWKGVGKAVLLKAIDNNSSGEEIRESNFSKDHLRRRARRANTSRLLKIRFGLC
eukprot:m.307900 g.307900  ORF g.307900 m.307900 type:complete len:132 (+) comp42998_c0_seq1:818-1213(+)